MLNEKKQNKTVFVDKVQQTESMMMFVSYSFEYELHCSYWQVTMQKYIRRWNNLLYTHQRSFNYNERMKLNIITKVKEVRRRTGSACGVSIHVHENTFRQEFCDKTQWVMVVWCRQWPICVSAGLGFIFYQFQSVFFVKRFHF